MDSNFKVIIVGGSVTGLTLANCFARAGIDYVLLERRDEIGPLETLGAGVIVGPNGARILDQLQLWQQIEDSTTPWEHMIAITPTGKPVFSMDAPQLVSSRYGHPCELVAASADAPQTRLRKPFALSPALDKGPV